MRALGKDIVFWIVSDIVENKMKYTNRSKSQHVLERNDIPFRSFFGQFSLWAKQMLDSDSQAVRVILQMKRIIAWRKMFSEN